jgi:hypothetical protein
VKETLITIILQIGYTMQAVPSVMNSYGLGEFMKQSTVMQIAILHRCSVIVGGSFGGGAA